MITMKKTSGVLVSFLLGGAIGGGIALLFAPQSGKRLRHDLSRKTNKIIEDGKNKTYDTWNGAMERVESSLDSANDYLNTGLEKVTRKKDKVKDSVKAGFSAFNEERDSKNNQDSTTAEDVENTRTRNT
jgi:gas vesicle protein